MKESELLKMKKDINNINNDFIPQIVREITMIKDLSIGTLELVKQLSEYPNAVEKLKEVYKPKEENKQPYDSVPTEPNKPI